MIYWKTYEFWMGVYLVLGKFISSLISPFIAEENYFLFDDMTWVVFWLKLFFNALASSVTRGRNSS